MVRRPPPPDSRGCLGLGTRGSGRGAEPGDSLSSPSWSRRLLVRMGASPFGISLRERYSGEALSLSCRCRPGLHAGM